MARIAAVKELAVPAIVVGDNPVECAVDIAVS
jgi:hypothetical protein